MLSVHCWALCMYILIIYWSVTGTHTTSAMRFPTWESSSEVWHLNPVCKIHLLEIVFVVYAVLQNVASYSAKQCSTYSNCSVHTQHPNTHPPHTHPHSPPPPPPPPPPPHTPTHTLPHRYHSPTAYSVIALSPFELAFYDSLVLSPLFLFPSELLHLSSSYSYLVIQTKFLNS